MRGVIIPGDKWQHWKKFKSPVIAGPIEVFQSMAANMMDTLRRTFLIQLVVLFLKFNVDAKSWLTKAAFISIP